MGAVIAVLLIALTMVGGVTVRMIDAERATLLARFAADQQSQVAEVAKALTEDLEDVRDDLLFSARLLQTADLNDDGERELRALLAAVAQYRLANVYDANGARLLQVVDPRLSGDFVLADVEGPMLQTAQRELASRSSFEISPVIAAPHTEGFHVFATTMTVAGRPTVLSLLVDTKPIFKRTQLLMTDPTARVLVATATSQSRPDPSFAAVEAAMRRGERGVVELDDAVIAYAPIWKANHMSWSLAKRASTSTLRAHERAIIGRLGVGGAIIALCLVAFAVYVVRVSRREMLVRERLRHAEALARLHADTDKILDNIPAGVIAFSGDLAIAAINRTLRDRVDGSVIGSPFDAAFPCASPASREQLRALLEQALRADRVQTRVAQQLDLFGESGQYSVHAVPFVSDVSATRVLLVIEDLSELTSLTNQLLHAEKLTTVGILAAGIAHEVGTPLGVIRGRAEFVIEKLGATHREAKDLSIILEQSDLVTRTIRELLDFSRAKATDIGAVSVQSVCSTVQELLRIELDRRKLALRVTVPADLPCVAADRDQLQQVLVNLLMNACDACTEGGSLALSAALEEGANQGPQDVVRIEVVDDGCGIPEEDRHRVFDPFFTTKKRGHGTGLGLSIAAQIVRNHAAHIELASEPHSGTRVVLRWPTAQASPVQESADRS